MSFPLPLSPQNVGTMVAIGLLGAAPLPGVGLPATVASINFQGDSIVAKVGATTPAQGWTAIASAAMSATEINNGTAGTILQNLKDEANVVKANNGRNRWFANLVTGGGALKVIAMGFNDARYTASASTLNVANYQTTLDRQVVDLLIQGVLPENIVLVSPYYITATGLVTGTSGFSGQTRGGFEAYVAAVAAVAAKYGTYYYDAYAYMRDNGGAALISVDNIHPNDAGHAIIAQGFLLARRIPVDVSALVPAATTVVDTAYGQSGAALTSRVGEINAVWGAQTGYAPSSPSAISPAGRVWSPTANGTYQIISIAPVADIAWEADLTWLSTVSGDRSGIALRMSRTENTFVWADWDQSGGQFRLFQIVAGTPTSLGAYVHTFTSGVRRLRIVALGTQVSLLMAIDGSPTFNQIIAPVTTAVTAAGGVGIRQGTVQTNSGGIHLSNFATALAA
jgi:lysophospholipase L1-like esterase